MARKAGKAEVGEEAAAEAALNHRARLILTAADAGENTLNHVRRLESEKLPVLGLPEGKAELGGALGYAGVAVVTLTDLGFASAAADKLAQADPAAEAARALLSQKQQKARRRRKDTRKNGKKSARRGNKS